METRVRYSVPMLHPALLDAIRKPSPHAVDSHLRTLRVLVHTAAEATRTKSVRFVPCTDAALEPVYRLLDMGVAGASANDDAAHVLNTLLPQMLIGVTNRAEAIAKVNALARRGVLGAARYMRVPLVLRAALGDESALSVLRRMVDKQVLGRMVGRAASGGFLAVVRACLERDTAGADVDARADDGLTPLMEAAVVGHLPVIEELLRSGADVNASSDDGWTALALAAQRGHRLVVKELIKAGAASEAVNRNGISALMLAALNGHLAVVLALMQDEGAHVNHADKHGGTPLMCAAANGNVAIVELLLKAGADPNAAEVGGGQTALAIAGECGHTTVEAILRKVVGTVA